LISLVVRSFASNVATPSASIVAVPGASAFGSARPRAS
jgi:hypothetical protein